MRLEIPELSLVLLVGPAGSGKSTFARRHFKPTEVLSSDALRAVVCDDERDQSATRAAFELLHLAARHRLARGLLTVVDATNLQPDARRPLVALARQHHVQPVAIVFNLPESVCLERDAARADRTVGEQIVKDHHELLRRTIHRLKEEGFRRVHLLNSAEQVDHALVERTRLESNLKELAGPFDIIGDIHGCFSELCALLKSMGYTIDEDRSDGTLRYRVRHPEGRRLIFLGDLVDRGPGIPDVLRLVMDTVDAGNALCVMGNHESKLQRWLQGRPTKDTHGFAQTREQMEAEPAAFRDRVARFIDDLAAHYVLDGGRLVVAHAGLREDLQGRSSGKVKSFALFGETTGETDEFGLPVRLPWANEYRGQAVVVYGHTPVTDAEWVNNTICVDTGCVYGGKLTALRYPEKALQSVTAERMYVEPVHAAPREASTPHPRPAPTSLRRSITTRIGRQVTIPPERASQAQEMLGRTSVDARWLIHLPPVMCRPEPSDRHGVDEAALEALAYYRFSGLKQAICQEQHPGRRAIAIVCREPDVAIRRFGLRDARAGVVHSRSGNIIFDDVRTESALLAKIGAALKDSGLWKELKTDWVCLDGVVTPDKRYAPFHLLASEATTHLARPHTWHLQTLQRLVTVSDALLPTLHKTVDLNVMAEHQAAQRWWKELGLQGRGMVIKPAQPVSLGRRGVVQPAFVCPPPRTPTPAQEPGRQRSLAMRQFILGVESLERFVESAPQPQIQECIAGILAMEIEMAQAA